MDTSLHLTEVIHIINALAKANSFLKRENIVKLNIDNKLFMTIAQYNLGIIDFKVKPTILRTPVFYFAETYKAKDWFDLIKYMQTCPENVELRAATIQTFIRNQPYEARELWRQILYKEINMPKGEALINAYFRKEVII